MAQRKIDDPVDRIDRVLSNQEREFARAFNLALLNIRNSVDLDALADMLEAGQFAAAVEAINDAAEAAGAAFGNTYAQGVQAAAQDAAKFLRNSVEVTVSFDQTNDRAVNMMRQNRLRLIREFSGEQRQVTRNVLSDGITRGVNPRDMARELRNSIGLTQYQQNVVNNYRRLLEAGTDGVPDRAVLERALRDGRFDRTVNRAIQNATPLTQTQIDKMVERYHDRWVNYRAETIARTEALRSVHQGTEEMYQQAIDMGQLAPDALEEKWVSAADERVRSSHARLNGQTRNVGDGPWQGDEGALRYPGDPQAPASETVNCRCIVTRRITLD